KELDCSYNLITGLTLSKGKEKVNLEKLYCSHNNLSSLDSFQYYLLDPNKLTKLSISDNKLSISDLTVFKRLPNLETLHIGGNNSEIVALKKEISELETKIKEKEGKK